MQTDSVVQLVSLSLVLIVSPLSRLMVLVVDGGTKSADVAAALAELLAYHT